MKEQKHLFDSEFPEVEKLPRRFTVCFNSLNFGTRYKTQVSIDGMQVGDVIDDNSKDNDFYRFHDVFHYTFATILGWSPCTRAMLSRKRKSVSAIDEIEDGARATITEEAISLMIFSKARKARFFESKKKVNQALLNQIKEMTDSFEVSIRSKQEWEIAILTGYSLFRNLARNNGGKIHFDMNEGLAIFEA